MHVKEAVQKDLIKMNPDMRAENLDMKRKQKDLHEPDYSTKEELGTQAVVESRALAWGRKGPWRLKSRYRNFRKS